MFLASKVIAALIGASMANAHMTMKTPTPYSKDSLNNSPLAADGSDFPCKLRENTFEAPSTETIIAIGESHPLTFIGSATHGGGSCQISLTSDLKPSKSSEWKVIKSFEGGCPANVEGNMSGGADVADPYTFNFTIPDGISAGKYTLAWTWFNRIGNREMYMNCAPITVSGGPSKRSTEELDRRAASFPPMFVANINGCTTPENVDIRFPQPGDYIEYDGESANLAKEGSKACTGTATFGGSGEIGPSGSSSSTSSSAPTESASGTAASASTAPVPEATPSSAPVEPEPASTSAAAPAPVTTSSPSSPGSTSSSSSGALTGSCSTEGQWNCISGTSFQRCASGTWSTAQQMSTGTQCSAGQSAELVVTASKKARHVSSMRFRNRAFGAHYAHALS
ncbi:endoglucanase [Penicillium digitatum]|uniref:Endoglucanase n=3 Tax=Penicillium digitatum TaxID=36651 RepID=K9G812_PEND2|nr:hypothetical protein PDIP_49380 [Penicillium digitatum Pd1]EKV10928.1 hypothetical protein PDIG_54160 [Penicillium digitatum PHI26]EKV13250.1 hypothetical protein PDIP_49380 [Penicillium digitatum Pd1]KAG0155700.1 hypothetical protein PDIDSM_2873 [Penicillium digitatum]QQK43500.1 endoglucanase [Penicillium digitatum]